MNPGHMMLIGWVITCGFITYGDLKTCHRLPWPPRFIFAGLVFGLLDIFAAFQAELAGIIAIGFVLAIVLNTLGGDKGKNALFFASVNCSQFTTKSTAQPQAFQTLQQAQPQGVSVV